MKAKLIRNKCPAVWDVEADVTACGTDSEYHMALVLKMYEEVGEIAMSPTDPEEYADLLEAMLALASSQDVEGIEILQALIAKRLMFGGFEDGLILVGESELVKDPPPAPMPSESQVKAKMLVEPFWIQAVLRRDV